MDDTPADRIYQGERIAFYVLGRYHGERVAPDRPYVVVSVSDPHAPAIALAESPLCRGVLRLRFHDRSQRGQPHPDRTVMTEEDARTILSFIGGHLDAVEVIVCQCEAGLSRSAGIAAALSRILQNDDRYFFQRFAPNDWVYRTLLEAHQKRGAGEAES